MDTPFMFALVSMLFTVAVSALVFLVVALWPDAKQKAKAPETVVCKPVTPSCNRHVQHSGFVLFDTRHQF